MNGKYTDNYQNENKDVNPVATGLLGAVAGAAIGVAVATILSDPQKRKKVGKQIQDIQKWGNKTLQELRHTSLEVEDTMKEHVETAADKAERVQKELEEAASRTQQQLK